MTKRYDEPIDVTSDPTDARPVAFRWRGRRYLVDQHLSSWRAAEPWAHGTQPDREYHRVLAHRAGTAATGDIDSDGFLVARGAGVGGPQDQIGAVYDVYCDPANGGWRLARVWD